MLSSAPPSMRERVRGYEVAREDTATREGARECQPFVVFVRKCPSIGCAREFRRGIFRATGRFLLSLSLSWSYARRVASGRVLGSRDAPKRTSRVPRDKRLGDIKLTRRVLTERLLPFAVTRLVSTKARETRIVARERQPLSMSCGSSFSLSSSSFVRAPSISRQADST